MAAEPYYADDSMTLYCGRMSDVISELATSGQRFDCAITDPPYASTNLSWDSWQYGWTAAVADVTSSMWCFGTLRMFGTYWEEFTDYGWQLSHDTVDEREIDTSVWEKHNGSGAGTAGRFRNVHELAAHWYTGRWSDIHHEVPRVDVGVDPRSRKQPLDRRHDVDRHHGHMAGRLWQDDGTRIARSVIRVRSSHRQNIHRTEKPPAILLPHIEHACPPGGIVFDPFAGSCSTGVAARLAGRRSVLIEADEEMCEKAVRLRLAVESLPLDVSR